MSATMARQGDQVQLEQSDMRLGLNMAKMAKQGFSHAAREEMQHLLKKPRTEVREVKPQGVVYPGHRKVEAGMDRRPAMVRESQTDSCLPCQNGKAKNPQTCWKGKGKGAPLPEAATPPPGTPPAQAGDNDVAQSSQIDGVPPWYVNIYTPLPQAQFFNVDAYAKDHKRDKYVIPDLLTRDGTSTGWYTNYSVLMQLTSILQTRVAYWVDLTVMMSMDRKEPDVRVLLLSTIRGHFMVYFKRYIYMHN